MRILVTKEYWLVAYTAKSFISKINLALERLSLSPKLLLVLCSLLTLELPLTFLLAINLLLIGSDKRLLTIATLARIDGAEVCASSALR